MEPVDYGPCIVVNVETGDVVIPPYPLLTEEDVNFYCARLNQGGKANSAGRLYIVMREERSARTVEQVKP